MRKQLPEVNPRQKGLFEKKHDVATVEWRVDHGGMLRDFVAAIKQARNQGFTQVKELLLAEAVSNGFALCAWLFAIFDSRFTIDFKMRQRVCFDHLA